MAAWDIAELCFKLAVVLVALGLGIAIYRNPCRPEAHIDCHVLAVCFLVVIQSVFRIVGESVDLFYEQQSSIKRTGIRNVHIPNFYIIALHSYSIIGNTCFITCAFQRVVRRSTGFQNTAVRYFFAASVGISILAGVAVCFDSNQPSVVVAALSIAMMITSMGPMVWATSRFIMKYRKLETQYLARFRLCLIFAGLMCLPPLLGTVFGVHMLYELVENTQRFGPDDYRFVLDSSTTVFPVFMALALLFPSIRAQIKGLRKWRRPPASVIVYNGRAAAPIPPTPILSSPEYQVMNNPYAVECAPEPPPYAEAIGHPATEAPLPPEPPQENPTQKQATESVQVLRPLNISSLPSYESTTPRDP